MDMKHISHDFSTLKTLTVTVLGLIRLPGTSPARNVLDGLMFYPWCFLFSPRILRGPSNDRPDRHMVGIWLNFIIPLQKFGVLPKKSGAKNMQNFG